MRMGTLVGLGVFDFGCFCELDGWRGLCGRVELVGWVLSERSGEGSCGVG